ncbi:helix-turn-helix transcriptional regulator [Crossiella sp. SN42]|uniref:helix-turn-helix domain-containing protein n=1 Tax=Crossiella sp. SN42 TaxID=2944808 RepID=UPI00207D1F2A|nr:helix-turn-helix transcriptional regulator [Crossiella sp. SN42]MCO1574984.1 helix-turn-helix transcriptional regulator [Crossiella sp. SN42]
MQTAKANGPAIRAAREDAELTLRKFHSRLTAEHGPVHIDTLRKIEQGARQPGVELFGAICRILGRTRSELSTPRASVPRGSQASAA